ncbi:hypothetical protein PQR12_23410 [Paraburkholderia nemoris]|uniref:hypothetical protein n=1 Tax=Paraburkholderia nemoris TaxID=2793076 RepID=UPI0038B81412
MSDSQSDAIRQLGKLMQVGLKIVEEKLEAHDRQLAQHESRIQKLEADKQRTALELAEQKMRSNELQSQLHSVVKSMTVPQKAATAHDLVEKNFTRKEAARMIGHSLSYTGKLVNMHGRRVDK